MAQTTGAMTGAVATLEINVNNSTWVSIAGSTQSVDSVDFAVVRGNRGTLDGATNIILTGRQEETTVTVNALYTEVADEALLKAIGSIKNNYPCNVRWSPAGAGGATYTTQNGLVSNVQLPNADSSAGEPLMFSLTILCGGIATSIS